jgi:hypothetical protein
MLAAGSMVTVVRHCMRSMAAGGSSWQARAARIVASLISGANRSSVSPGFSSFAVALEAVEAGVVPVLLACLARSGHPDDEQVQYEAARALIELVGALGFGGPVGASRQLPEPLQRELRPAVAALVELLRAGSGQFNPPLTGCRSGADCAERHRLDRQAPGRRGLRCGRSAAGHTVVPQARGGGGGGAGCAEVAAEADIPRRRCA